jgi:hypothetical protein
MTVSKSFIWQAILALMVAAATWIGSGVHPSAAVSVDAPATPIVREAPALSGPAVDHWSVRQARATR